MNMRIELYNTEDEEGIKIKEFLVDNNIPFNEIITNNINLLNEVHQARLNFKKSILKITKSHSINIINGYLKWDLCRLLEHIKKYHPNINK